MTQKTLLLAIHGATLPLGQFHCDITKTDTSVLQPYGTANLNALFHIQVVTLNLWMVL